MRESILITGANGLVGRATLARLGSSRRVYALVREPLQGSLLGSAVPVVHNLCQHHDPEPPEVPDTIVHLAQSSRYRDFPEGALDVFEVNVGSTQRLLDWACRQGVKRFVYASSGGIYGHGETAFEEDALIKSSAFLGHYTSSKRCGELLTEAYGGHMIVIVLRFFFVYGPGQRRTMLIPRLIDSVLHGRPIILQGKDGLRINPVYVDDAATAIEAAVRLEASETFNIAGPKILTLREIGELIGEAMERKPNFEVQLDVEPKHIVGSTSKMSRLLGSPEIAMTEGVRRMVAIDQAASGYMHAD